MAYHVFIEEKVDVAIIEVGIGGEYDCTNVIKYFCFHWYVKVAAPNWMRFLYNLKYFEYIFEKLFETPSWIRISMEETVEYGSLNRKRL